MFIHLRAHSEFSIVDGLLQIKPYVKQVAAMGIPAIALSDHSNLFALVKFYKAAWEAGLKPIIAADLFLQREKQVSLFTAFCQNERGYKNLTQLISLAYLKGQTADGASIRWEWLQKHHEGLIILSGGRLGDIGRALIARQKDLVQQYLQQWAQLFPQRFYLELQRTGREHEILCNQAALELAQQYDLPVVATNDVRFLHKDDFEAHEARVCIHAGDTLNEQRSKIYSEQQYLRTPEEMAKLFVDIPEALSNTVEIAKRCNVILSLGVAHLPQFPLPAGSSLENFFRQQVEQGLAQRFSQQLEKSTTISADQYQQRLSLEIDVIIRMGFAGYFLIVADFIAWARQQDIPVGPGRGSGAGSLVAYALQITDLDPLEHDLLFERFLNPERVSMPDFDIDFCMERRDEVIDYVTQRYGSDAVSQIITYGTMTAKAVVRDVGRVLGMPYGFVDKIAKLIPFELGITLEKALEQEKQLAERYRLEPDVATLIDLAKKLEGLTRNVSKHAGGVVIAPTKLTDFLPLYLELNGVYPVTQFDKDDVEAVGLVKFDFLGLRTLTIIHWALQTINATRQQQGQSLIDIHKIALHDEKTFTLLKQCATTAVFQLESRGMKELIRRLQPDSFGDITALVALFRPGPLQSGMVDDFMDCKHGRAVIKYLHPSLEPILKSTYGVILYQEQVMQIAQALAGYSLGEADILRRAMGKKKPEEMAKQREIFIQGCVVRHIEAGLAEQIFDLMEKFAGYGFNKSHSAAYALLAYQTAWLKAHYPAEFMAAVLSADMDNTDKVVGFVEECKRLQLKMIRPNINQSLFRFTVNPRGEIIYGLGAIKGVGQGVGSEIVREREKNGLFKDLFSFCERIHAHKITRRTLEPLIRCGACDDFQQERATLLASIDHALRQAEQRAREASAGQSSLFADWEIATEASMPYVIVPALNPQQRLRDEKETLGIYLSGHPLEIYQELLARQTTTTINQLPYYRQKNVCIAGILLSWRFIVTKAGRRMAVLQLEDCSARTEVTVFSQLLEEQRQQWVVDEIYLITGKVEDDNFTEGVRLVADSITTWNVKQEKTIKRIILSVNTETIDYLLLELPKIIVPFKGGDCQINIAYQSAEASVELRLDKAFWVQPNNVLIEKLSVLCGSENLVLK